MQLWLQGLLTGLAVGTVYGVIGVGYVIIHRIAGMVNFAQGDIAMIGAFGAVMGGGFLAPPLAVLCGGLAGAAAALLVYWMAIHPLRNKGALVQTIATLGMGLAIRSAAQLYFGTEPHQLPPVTGGGPIKVFGASLSVQTVWLVLIMVVLFFVLRTYFDKTMTGRALSACSINRYAAGLVGINYVKMAMIAFVISGLVTGLMGGLVVGYSFANVGMGFTLGLKGFVAAILGGFDKIGVTMVGGIIVGVLESWVAAGVSTTYQDVIIYALLIVLLIVRPSGLTRMQVTSRV